MFYFIIHILILFSAESNGEKNRSCGVFPQDLQVEDGWDAEVTCRSSCASGTVFWTLNGRRVGGSRTRAVDAAHTRLLLPHAELQDPAPATSVVQCHSEESRQVLGGTTIQRYTKPHNLSCIFHSNGEIKEGLPKVFTCSWEHRTFTPLKINYSVICAHCTFDLKEICASHVTNCTSETLNASQVSFVENNTIYVKAKTQAWETQSSVYTFTSPQIFRIPPRKVNVTARLDHILVEWNNLPNLGVNGTCQVQYKYTQNEEIIKRLNVALTPAETGSVSVHGVQSCHTYTVCVRCALTRAPWSYWSPERTIQTHLKKRDVKLDLWRKVTKLHKEIKVHIKWKGIPLNCPGTLSYSISHVPRGENTSTDRDIRRWCGNSSCDLTLNREADAINLTVYYNGDVLAEEALCLTAEADRLFGVHSVAATRDERGLLVGWDAPPRPASAYVVDWTHGGNDFEWKRTDCTYARLHGLVHGKPYNITVTPVFGHKTGAAAQISGVCSSFTDPGNVTIVNLEAYDRSALLSWSVKPQEECSDAVASYTIFYGRANGAEMNLTIKNTEQNVYLKNLEPNTQYSVHVVAAARSGNSKSRERLFKTKLFDPLLITVLSITGSALLLLFIGLFLAAQKLNEKPVPNPGLGSLALWPQTTNQKTMNSVEPFYTPSESVCERVYPDQMQQTSTTSCKSPVPSEQKDQTTASPEHYERPFLSSSAAQRCGDLVSLLTAEDRDVNPYRSQTADKSPVPHSSRKGKCAAMKWQEKTPSYVSLDMFD